MLTKAQRTVRRLVAEALENDIAQRGEIAKALRAALTEDAELAEAQRDLSNLIDGLKWEAETP